VKAARDQGADAHAYDVPSSGAAGGAFHGINTPGTSRIVVDEDRGVIIGATFTGTDVAEWLQAATIAIVSTTPVELLWQAVPAFPTRSEIWLRLLERREADLAAERSAAGPAAASSARPAQPDREPLATAPALTAHYFQIRTDPTCSSSRNRNPATRHAQLPAPLAGHGPEGAERATFAAGCFWGVERPSARSAGCCRPPSAGGHVPSPTYRQVCGHRTGHAGPRTGFGEGGKGVEPYQRLGGSEPVAGHIAEMRERAVGSSPG